MGVSEADVGSNGPARKQRVRRRAAEVQEAATDLFHRQGYEATSVEDIAQSLGILKGSLYYYISSKEDLLFEIVSEVHSDVQHNLDESLLRDDLRPLQRVAVFVRGQALYNVENATRIAVYYRDMQQLAAPKRDKIRAQRRSQHRAMVNVLTEAQKAGEVAGDVRVGMAAHSMFATINWIYTWWRPGGSVSPDEVAESCVTFVLRGIAATPPGSRTT
jgi:AcrR family transcriptional regulator